MIPITSEQYLEACQIACSELGVELDDVLDHCNKHEVVQARRIVWYGLQDSSNITYQRLAHISKFDRTTIYLGIERLSEELYLDKQLAQCVARINTRIASVVKNRGER